MHWGLHGCHRASHGFKYTAENGFSFGSLKIKKQKYNSRGRALFYWSKIEKPTDYFLSSYDRFYNFLYSFMFFFICFPLYTN
jgi:hypothetical protein